MDPRHHRRFVILERRIIREASFEFPNQKPRRACPNDEHDRARRENETEETGYLPHATWPFEFRKLFPGEINTADLKDNTGDRRRPLVYMARESKPNNGLDMRISRPDRRARPVDGPLVIAQRRLLCAALLC